MNKILFLLIAVAAMLLLQQGCQEQKSDFTPLSGGFGIEAQWVGIDSGPGAELYYKTNGSKPVLIWPFLTGEMYYTNDLVFFMGFIRDKDRTITIQRYFAVQAPGPAIDISDDLLKLFADSNHLNFGEAKKHYWPLKMRKVSEQIEFYGFGDQPPNTLLVNWEQLSNIIQDVKRTGTPHAVEDPHTLYLKKDY